MKNKINLLNNKNKDILEIRKKLEEKGEIKEFYFLEVELDLRNRIFFRGNFGEDFDLGNLVGYFRGKVGNKRYYYYIKDNNKGIWKLS